MPALFSPLVFGFCLIAASPLVVAAEQPDESRPVPTTDLQKEVIASIAELDNDQFSQRRNAFFEIWKFGKAALPEVQKAKSSSSLQVSQAASALETLLLLELTSSELGSDVFELLINPTPRKIVTLCQRGNWKLAEHLVATEERLTDAFREPLSTHQLNRITETAIEQGSPSFAWPVVRTVCLPASATYDGTNLSIWLSVKTGLELSTAEEAHPNEENSREENLGKANQDTQALRLAYNGNGVAALELQISDAARRKITTRNAVWSQLQNERFIDNNLRPNDSHANRAVEAVLLEYAGKFAESKAIWQTLLPPRLANNESAPEEQTQDADTTAADLLDTVSPFEKDQLIWALICSGHADTVEDYLEKSNPEAAFDFYLSGNDYERAFKSVELDLDLSNFESWLAERDSDIAREVAQPTRGFRIFSQSARVCSLLTSLGFRSEAERLLEILAERANGKINLWTGAGSIIGWMGRAEQRVLCLAAVEKHIDILPGETRVGVLEGLFPEISNCAATLYRTAPLLAEQNGRPPSVIQLIDRLHSLDREFFEQYSSTTTIADWLIAARRGLLSDRAAMMQPELLVTQLTELAKLAVGCGLAELGLEFAELDIRDIGGPIGTVQDQWVEAARIRLEQGDSSRAAELLKQYRSSENAFNNQLALVDEVRTLLLSGNYDEAIRLEQSRWLRPVTDLTYMRQLYSQVIEELSDRGDFSAAREYAEAAFVLSDFASRDIYWAANDFAGVLEELEEFETSSDVLRAPLVEALQPGSQTAAFFIRLNLFNYIRFAAQRERLQRAIACIIRKEFTEAEHHIQVGQTLQPQDIEMVVQCYPRLVKAGRVDIAERYFDSFESAMKGQIEQWPNDATALNNLAWMYAQCDRNLREALSLSQKATELAPNSAIYLDTLAEVYFRSGSVDQAQKLMRECVRLSPREKHYRDNLVRYTTAQD